MDDIAIHVQNLGKRYRLGQSKQSKMLRESIADAAYAPLRYLKRGLSTNKVNEYIWALKDVSFDIPQGEVVGVIGRNGSGKSTLLKILSRITTPTEGCARLNGRVGSLLEVGTGFHPELTGRENIFLSGSILGMEKREIENRFDDIVKFSEIEKFLDTPVKRYSSGMHVRLAFAVAAHLEPEILLIDEVLAVGDASFQKKCLGKMSSIAKEGRTVLFVSHNINAIEQLCNSCILLDLGRLKEYDKDVLKVTRNYLFNRENNTQQSEWMNSGNEFDNEWFKPLHFYIGDKDANKISMPISNISEAWLYLEGDIKIADPALNICYAIYSQEGILVYWSAHTDQAENLWPELRQGHVILRSKIPQRLLNEGMYRIELICSLHCRSWLFPPGGGTAGIILEINGGLSDSPYWLSKRPGAIAPVLPWESFNA